MGVFNLAGYLSKIVSTLSGMEATAALRRNLVLRTFQRLGTAKSILPSASNLLGLFRAKGIGIRTQDFYRIYKSFETAGIQAARQQVAPPTQKPLKADLPIWPGFTARRYLYDFTMEVHDYQNDKWISKDFRMSSNSIYSPSGAEDTIRSWWQESGYSQDVDLDSIHFVAVWKSSET
jgi:hypothetical protein